MGCSCMKTNAQNKKGSAISQREEQYKIVNPAENDNPIQELNFAEPLKIDSSSRKNSNRKSADQIENKENYDSQFDTPSEHGQGNLKPEGQGAGGINSIFTSVENHTKTSLKRGSQANGKKPKFSSEVSVNEKMKNLENESKKSKPGSFIMTKSNGGTPVNKQSYFVFKNERVGPSAQMYKIGKEDIVSGPEDFYFELRKSELKKYNEIQSNIREQLILKTDSIIDSNDIDFEKSSSYQAMSNPYSTFNEWSKLIQKQAMNGDKLSDNHNNKEKSLMMDVYKAILMLKDRNWYEEIVNLFKERNMSKTSQNLTTMSFDRKYIQIHEHFRWMVSAIGNMCFNNSRTVGCHEFSWQKSVEPPRHKRSGSNISLSLHKVNSNAQPYENDNINSGLDEAQTPSKLGPYRGTMVRSSSQGNLEVFRPATDPKKYSDLFYEDLPHFTVAAWQTGFVWKGVYLKMFSKKKGERLKAEIKALKHIAIEYLQTDSITRFQDFQGSFSLINESMQDLFNKTAYSTSVYLNYILPLIGYCESSSWVLLATPFINNNKLTIDEFLHRANYDVGTSFKNSLLLSNLNFLNLKSYARNSDERETTLGTYSQSPNSFNLILINSLGLIPKLDDITIPFIINEEYDSNIIYLESAFTQSGMIEVDNIKRLLRYQKLEIDASKILDPSKGSMRNSSVKKSPSNQKKVTYRFELLKCKVFDWKLQIIHVVCSDPDILALNRRATELISLDSSVPKDEKIFGNVLIFGNFSNKNSIIHPTYITDQETLSQLNSKSPSLITSTPILNQINNKDPLNKDLLSKKSDNSNVSTNANLSKKAQVNTEIHLKTSFSEQYIKSIKEVAEKIENSDSIFNYASIRDLFHRFGLNMRFSWIVLSMLKNSRAKSLLGVDILCRTLKRIVNQETSSNFKYLKDKYKQDRKFSDRTQEELNEKQEFFSENLFKQKLAHLCNVLLTKELDADIKKEQALIALALNFSRMRVFDFTQFLPNQKDISQLLSSELLNDIVLLPYTESSLFLSFVQSHFNITLNPDLNKKLRNDKFFFHINSSTLDCIKPSDIQSVYYQSISYVTLRERATLFLIKQSSSSAQSCVKANSELLFPPALYKVKPAQGCMVENSILMSNLDSYLSNKYYLTNFAECFNDWVVYLEVVFNSLLAVDGDQNFLIEAYILQIMQTYFVDQDEEQCKLTLEKIINQFNSVTPLCPPEILIVVHTWVGIVSETKTLVESEQNYIIALLMLHKTYGDPRGRGAIGVAWELFLTWRLSIISRLQNKAHDAEYVEELYDATVISLRRNLLNRFMFEHYIYSNPLGSESIHLNGEKSDEDTSLNNTSGKPIDYEHPFSHWTKHFIYDDNSSKVEALTKSFPKRTTLFSWMLRNLPTLSPTGIVWQTSSLKNFMLTVMQGTCNVPSALSSVSTHSLLEKKQDTLGKSTVDASTPQLKKEKKRGFLNQGGNIVQIFEKDQSTFSKRESVGIAYVWGQNTEGQLGICLDSKLDENDKGSTLNKKLKVNFPKLLLPLKDTIILSIACGHTHTMAITINRNVLAWGSNRSLQLGLGENAPANVLIPTQIPDLNNIIQVSCGHEHTIALDQSRVVYSWGQGEGGLLGHGDIESQPRPKIIEALRNLNIEHLVCGGLHSIALTKNGWCYSWGRAEGGQLGLPFNLLITDCPMGEIYLTTPKRIKSALEGLVVKQVACGDAHSLALTQGGQVYGWGYTHSGQLGMGITGDNYESIAGASIQIKEPYLIQKLSNQKITAIYAGSTFSLFLTEKKDLLSCGLNDYNQLGLDKNPIKLTTNTLENYRAPVSNKYSDCAIPKRLECFHCVPILAVGCGENHSLAVAIVDNKYFMVFAWGMQKHAQLGLGDIGSPCSNPRPITYLQDVMVYNMACGAYNSIIISGDTSKIPGADTLKRIMNERQETKWNFYFYDPKDKVTNRLDFSLSNLENFLPSEEGKIDNPKSIKHYS